MLTLCRLLVEKSIIGVVDVDSAQTVILKEHMRCGHSTDQGPNPISPKQKRTLHSEKSLSLTIKRQQIHLS